MKRDGSFSRITEHLAKRGVSAVPPELQPDLEALARRARIAANNPELRRAGIHVELSPYMQALLRLPPE